jgi:hypothetical protein
MFPVSKEHMHQLATTISWYIWKGAILRVPLSTLQGQTQNRSLGLIDIAAKCRTLFLTRLMAQGEREETLSRAWIQAWDRRPPKDNPPNIRAIPRTFECIRSNGRIWHPGGRTSRIGHLRDGYTEPCRWCTQRNAHHKRYAEPAGSSRVRETYSRLIPGTRTLIVNCAVTHPLFNYTF